MESKDILHLLTKEPLENLTKIAQDILLTNKGDFVHCRGLIEFSNICKRNCLYCGLRAQNSHIKRYMLGKEEILQAAKQAVEAGADTIVLQSGEGAARAGWIAELITEIKTQLNTTITLSLGECSIEDYKLWKNAGASRYLLKHETASKQLYTKMHPGYSLDDRILTLQKLADLGYETGSGFIIGLADQNIENYVDDILLCKNLNLGMVGAGPFIPQTDTPLANNRKGNLETTLRIIAALRIFMPHINIPATTALETLHPEKGQYLALKSGANVIMPSFTPAYAAQNYKIYNSKAKIGMETARKTIAMAGRRHNIKANVF